MGTRHGDSRPYQASVTALSEVEVVGVWELVAEDPEATSELLDGLPVFRRMNRAIADAEWEITLVFLPNN